jgi:hypothetical protein
MEKYYISTNRLTLKLQEIALDRDSLQIGDQHYTQLSEKPKGRSVLRRLVRPGTEEVIIIYK